MSTYEYQICINVPWWTLLSMAPILFHWSHTGHSCLTIKNTITTEELPAYECESTNTCVTRHSKFKHTTPIGNFFVTMCIYTKRLWPIVCDTCMVLHISYHIPSHDDFHKVSYDISGHELGEGGGCGFLRGIWSLHFLLDIHTINHTVPV